MLVYNVTLNVEASIETEWLQWMKEVHLPEVMATGKFKTFRMYKIRNHEPDDKSINYCVQYDAESEANYLSYINEFAPALKEKTLKKYGEQVLAFRTILDLL